MLLEDYEASINYKSHNVLLLLNHAKIPTGIQLMFKQGQLIQCKILQFKLMTWNINKLMGYKH